MSVKQSVEWLAAETEVLGENLPQCRSVHHKYHVTWLGLEPGPGNRHIKILKKKISALTCKERLPYPCSYEIFLLKSHVETRVIRNEVNASKSYRNESFHSDGRQWCVLGKWGVLMWSLYLIFQTMSPSSGADVISLSCPIPSLFHPSLWQCAVHVLLYFTVQVNWVPSWWGCNVCQLISISK
jgi:hypothetical protein